MKTTKLISLLALTILLAQGCSPDEGPITPEPIEQTDEVKEEVSDPEDNETPEDSETPEEENSNTASDQIADNILITGSEKVEGAPPTPNQGISLSLATENDIAFPEVGFAIPFESDGEVTGAYIQFKAEGQAYADSYYDVSLLDNTTSKKNAKKSTFPMKRPSEDEFNINLTESLNTGTFCYAICVYDGNGNISAPQEFCVSISSWGGNDGLLGDWNLIRSEDFADGIVDTVTVGIEECNEPIGNDTDTTCYLFEYETLQFNEDGTFIVEIREANRNPATEPTYENYDIERLEGNWSFDTRSGALYLVIFKYEYEENGQLLETEVYPDGDAELGAAQRIELSATTLTLVFDEIDYEGDGIVDESFTVYYERP